MEPKAGSAAGVWAAWARAALALPLAWATALGTGLALHTDLAWTVVLLHLLLVAPLGLGAAALVTLVSAPLPARGGRVLALALALSGFGLLVLTGLGAWVSRRSWGMDLNADLLENFLPQAGELVVLFGWPAYALLALVAGLIAGLAWAWVRGLARATQGLPPSWWKPCLAGLLLGSAAWILGGAWLDARDWAFSGDPLLSALRRGPSTVLRPTARRLAALAQDELYRARPPRSASGRRNLVLVMMDGVRPSHLDFHGYGRATTPFLSGLIRGSGGWAAPHAYTAGTESFAGITAIMTGRSIASASLRSYGLVEHLARHGYKTHLMLAGDHRWYGMEAVYGRKHDSFRDMRHRDKTLPLHDDRQLVRWAGDLPPAGPQPSLLVFFMMGTHQLSPLAEDERHFSADRGWAKILWRLPRDPAERAAVFDHYDDQLHRTDRNLADLWRVLESKGYLRDCLALFTSDHGQLLGEYGGFGHGPYAWEPATRIPLLAWSDRPVAFNRRRRAWSLDVAPTLAEAGGLPPAPGWEGLSLASPLPRPSLASEMIYGNDRAGALVVEDGARVWKLHCRLNRDQAPRAERLFDLAQDPDESRDLLPWADPGLKARLLALAAEHFSH